MNTAITNDDRYVASSLPLGAGTGAGAVSWGAILAGAAAAASLSIILLILGVGLGLSSVSPWTGAGVSAETFGVGTVLWLTFTQLAASGMGGYLAGRLRTRWAAAPADEVYFRDTAHGFLAWGVASLATAALLSSAIGAIVSGGMQAGAAAAGGAATAGAAAATAAAPQLAGAAGGASAGNPNAASTAYFVDSLFRRDVGAAASGTSTAAGSATGAPTPVAGNGVSGPDVNAMGPAPSAEVGRIFASGLRGGAALPAGDVRYVGQLVAQRTGMSQADAEKRVSDAYANLQTQLRDAETKARENADKARKASAYAALWIFVSLLVGAFVASFAATLGGRQRDF